MEKHTDYLSLESYSLQDYLSIGYLYLLTLGIIRDSIYYNFLGINILNYADILDVLLSPLVYLMGHFEILIAMVLCYAAFNARKNVLPKWDAKYLEKRWYRLFRGTPSGKSTSQTKFIRLGAIALFSFFLGSGLGGGFKMKRIIETKNYKISHQVIFNNEEVLKVKLVGKNSNYLFFVRPGEPTITIAPIEGNVRFIQKLTP